VWVNATVGPIFEGFFRRQFGFVQLFVGRGGEMAGDALEFGLRDGGRAVLGVRPFFIDLSREFLNAERLDQNLDARLVGVVAAAVAVVDAQDRFEIGRRCCQGRNSRIMLPRIGVRPMPPPTMTREACPRRRAAKAAGRCRGTR
jgi:hypothetical protein